MGEFATLPELLRGHSFSIDLARALIRKNADLKKLGRMIGCTRVYTRDEGAKIIEALRERAERAVATA